MGDSFAGSVAVESRAIGAALNSAATFTLSRTGNDVIATLANVGKPVNSIGTAKFDLNADGSITQADVSVAKAQSGKVIP